MHLFVFTRFELWNHCVRCFSSGALVAFSIAEDWPCQIFRAPGPHPSNDIWVTQKSGPKNVPWSVEVQECPWLRTSDQSNIPHPCPSECLHFPFPLSSKDSETMAPLSHPQWRRSHHLLKPHLNSTHYWNVIFMAWLPPPHHLLLIISPWSLYKTSLRLILWMPSSTWKRPLCSCHPLTAPHLSQKLCALYIGLHFTVAHFLCFLMYFTQHDVGMISSTVQVMK